MIKSWSQFITEEKDWSSEDAELKDKRIKLIKMYDPYTKLKYGDEGTIQGVDGIGQIMVKWDSGSTLSVIPGTDSYVILD